MQKPDKHNIYKFYFGFSTIFFVVSLVVGAEYAKAGTEDLQEPGIEIVKVMVLGGMSAALVLFALGVLTFWTRSPSRKRAKQSAHEKKEELLDIIVNSEAGSLLTKAPKGVTIFVDELIEALDRTDRNKCGQLLDELYQLMPACVLQENYGDFDGRILKWYQYDLCIMAAKEDIEIANKIKHLLLSRLPEFRIYLDATDVGWLKGDGLIKKVFYESSWKCLALLSHDSLRPEGRKPELFHAMRRNHDWKERDCKDYLMPIPLDEKGLDYIKRESYLSKYAKNAEIIKDRDYLCEGVADTIATLAEKSPHYDPSAYSNREGEITLLQKHFAVALSFPSELQATAKAVAEELENVHNEEVFYYPKFEHVLSGEDLHKKLPIFYRNQTELVVTFLCAGYAGSQWCWREWLVILDLLNKGQSSKVMLLRFDSAPIPRLPPTRGYIDCSHLTPSEIAERIVQRLKLIRGEE